ncbi:serine protease [Candidatus Thioglobus sp.]|nr:serine protease [Candidatus Thioglobus sp.]
MKKLLTLISLFLFFAPSITFAQEFEVKCTNTVEVKNGVKNWDTEWANDTFYFTIDLDRKLLDFKNYIDGDTGDKFDNPAFAKISSVRNGIIFAQGDYVNEDIIFKIKYDVFENRYEVRNFENSKVLDLYYVHCSDTNNLLANFLNENINDSSPKSNYANSAELIPAASGSGFAISSDGYIVTNNHVIEGCSNVEIIDRGQTIPANLISFDINNDLALLKSNFSPLSYFPLSRKNPYALMEIYVAGYPFGYDLSTPVKITRGIVSSLAGLGNNFSQMQIDAAIQPGNSGGPILDEKGNVVGVAVSKLDLEQMIEAYGVVPEGTNFGIKSNVVINFLESNNIMLIDVNTKDLPKQELGKKITDGTYYISCLMTMAQINNMKERKVMFSDLK